MRVTSFISLCVISLGIMQAACAKSIRFEYPSVSYVNFQSPDLSKPDATIDISGQLRIPADATSVSPVPAVLILHGSSGIDSRGAFYTKALNAHGYATLEIDMWAARNVGSPAERPSLPSLTVPDAFSALEFLSGNEKIDKNKISILGFSWGGVVSMLAATSHYQEVYGNGQRFAANIAHYPVCWAYTANIPGISFTNINSDGVLIQIGELDDYDESAQPCEDLIAGLPEEERELVQLKVYQDAYHAWDRLQPAIVVQDPFSHLGQGGEVRIEANIRAAKKSKKTIIKFLQNTVLN